MSQKGTQPTTDSGTTETPEQIDDRPQVPSWLAVQENEAATTSPAQLDSPAPEPKV